MKIISLIEEVRSLSGCRLWPPQGLPQLCSQHLLPEDVRVFYEHCGGFCWDFGDVASRDFLLVLPPNQVLLANPIIAFVPESESGKSPDISWDWYTIAQVAGGDYFTIDFGRERLGRCYDGFHETYALPGDTPILAFTFTDFLSRIVAHILNSALSEWNWEGSLRELSLGDAYDGF